MANSHSGRYCLQCRYDLTGLAEHRCPECGKAFDPKNENTWQTQRDHVNQQWNHWDLLASLACEVAAVFCFLAASLGPWDNVTIFVCILILLMLACVGLHFSMRLVVHGKTGWWSAVGFLLLMFHAMQAMAWFVALIFHWPGAGGNS